MAWLRSSRPASDSYGHTWPGADAVIEVDDEQAATLLAIQDAGFTLADAPTKPPAPVKTAPQPADLAPAAPQSDTAPPAETAPADTTPEATSDPTPEPEQAPKRGRRATK